MKILSFLIATLLSTGALAQNQVITVNNNKKQEVTENVELPMYISFGLGKSKVNSPGVNIPDANSFDVNVGVFVSPKLSAEFGYAKLGNFSNLSTSSLELGLKYNFNPNGKFSPNFKVGFSRNYGEIITTGFSANEINNYFGLGVDFKVDDDIKAFVEYTSYNDFLNLPGTNIEKFSVGLKHKF